MEETLEVVYHKMLVVLYLRKFRIVSHLELVGFSNYETMAMHHFLCF